MTPEEKKKAVQEKLQKAVELEWSTIPPYLVARFSLWPGSNGASAAIIRSVYMEEMLHIVLAANVLAATGGRAVLGAENLPSYPLTLQFQGQAFQDRQFEIHLAAFSPETIDTFLQIELPENLRPQAASLDFLVVPGYTIGGFYRGIMDDLETLCAEKGEPFVFSGDPGLQVPDDLYWGSGGKVIQVKNLETARKRWS
jgi:hypothetical protein